MKILITILNSDTDQVLANKEFPLDKIYLKDLTYTYDIDSAYPKIVQMVKHTTTRDIKMMNVLESRICNVYA